MDLINRYDHCKKDLDDEKKEIIMSMYKISSKLIDKLKKVEYKMNTNRKKTKQLQKKQFLITYDK